MKRERKEKKVNLFASSHTHTHTVKSSLSNDPSQGAHQLKPQVNSINQ